MVDVGGKAETDRRARARAVVRMSPETAAMVARGDAPKGDVLGTARIAGIQAAKRTDELIPLAHPLAAHVRRRRGRRSTRRRARSRSTSEARTTGPTGVEMEALTACAVAALAVYDMVKGIERGVTIEEVALLEKTGGKAGLVRGDHRNLCQRMRAAIITISTSLSAGPGRGRERPGAGRVRARARRGDRGDRDRPRRPRADRVARCATTPTATAATWS